MDRDHRIAIEAGISFHWDRLPRQTATLDGLPPDIEELSFRREDKSYRGLPKLTRLRTLLASRVNQDVVDAIAQLPELEVLWVKLLSAASLEPLANNRKLRRLILTDGSKVPDMEWTRGLSKTIEVLHLQGLFRATDIDPIGELTQLTTLGLEGGIDTKLKLDSLAPLSGLANLQYLFLASTRVADKSLAPLHGLKQLRHLRCAAYFPDSEFIALKKALPHLDCDWFDLIEAHGSIKKGMAALSARLRGA